MSAPVIRARLPWPSAKLSPNSRVHWAQKSRAAREYRSHCAWIVAACPRVPILPSSRIVVDLTFFGPTLGRYDVDNALARMKSGLDGVADALRVDDSRFELRIRKSPPGTKGGYVQMEITIE